MAKPLARIVAIADPKTPFLHNFGRLCSFQCSGTKAIYQETLPKNISPL
jgi:hypothetical protein